MALTGDHYRTLEAIKPLEPVINDSSGGPADLAQQEGEGAREQQAILKSKDLSKECTLCQCVCECVCDRERQTDV